LYDTVSHETYISIEKVISKEIQKVSKLMTPNFNKKKLNKISQFQSNTPFDFICF